MTIRKRLKRAYNALRGNPQPQVQVTVPMNKIRRHLAHTLLTNDGDHWSGTHRAHEFFQNHPDKNWFLGEEYAWLRDETGEKEWIRVVPVAGKGDMIPMEEL